MKPTGSEFEYKTAISMVRGDNVTLFEADCTATIGYEKDGDSVDWWPVQFTFEDSDMVKDGRSYKWANHRYVHIERGDPLFGIFADCLNEQDEKIRRKIAFNEQDRLIDAAEARADMRRDYTWSDR